MSFVQRFLGRNRWEIAATIFPFVVDAIHFFFFEQLNGVLRGVLATPGTASAVLLVCLYFGWLVSLVAVGTLVPETQLKPLALTVREKDGRVSTLATTWPKFVFFYPSLLFGLLFMMLIIQATGMDLNAPAVSENVQSFVIGGAVLLFIAHCIVAAVDGTPKHVATSPTFFIVLVPVVLVGEIVLNLATAAWLHYFGADAKDLAEASARSGGELVFGSIFFLLVFAGPRFTFLSRHFTVLSLASGLAFVIWEVWLTLDRIAF